MKLVILITAQAENGLTVAQAWQDAGAPGVTIIRAHGLHSLQREAREGTVELPRSALSMAAMMAAIIDRVEERAELILSVVDDDMVNTLEKAAANILGDLSERDTGVMFILPIERAIGVLGHDEQS